MSDSDRLPAWRRYLRFWGNNVAADVDDEIAFHLEALVGELVTQGTPVEEARREALRRFGDRSYIARTMRELATKGEATMRRTEWKDALSRDVRFAVRQLAKSRAFTIAALVSLSLGIGANTAIFSAVNAVLLHPVATHDVDRIMIVRTNLPTLNLMSDAMGPGEAIALMERRELFDASAAWIARSPVLTEMGEPRRLAAARTIGGFFDVFGLAPEIGRFYRPDESERDQHRVAVLSYALWQQLGGERQIIGKRIVLGFSFQGESYEVVGVAPRGFDYPRGTEIYVPAQVTPAVKENRSQMAWTLLGRIKTGTTPKQFAAGIRAEQQRWHDHPGWSYKESKQFFNIIPLTTMLAGQLRPVLLVLFGAVGFVLLIACANVASLQLVRGTARTKELAVRAALGAERGIIIRQLLVENLLLSLAGGVLGIGVGRLVLAALRRVGADQMPALAGVKLSPGVLAFTAVIAIVAGLLVGLAPALRGARVDLNSTLKESTHGGSIGGEKHRLLQVAVVAQVALTMMLLLGSGLFIRSLQRLLDQSPGFKPEHVVTMRTTTSGPRYAQPGALTLFYDELLARLRGAPGVSAVGLVGELPFSTLTNSNPFVINGRDADPNGPVTHANMRVVSDDYFAAIGIPIVRGRAFNSTDTRQSPSVVIIDAQLAKQFFPNEDPIGKRIKQGREGTIVGVVGTVSQGELGEAPKATIYHSFRQAEWYSSYFITLRSRLPAPALMNTVRNAVTSIDRNAPVFDVRTLDERIAISLAPRRLAMTVLTALAAVSLLLAVFGLYGVISYAVSQRTTEFGIRAALGADPRQVRSLVVRQGLQLAVVGVALGLAAAWVAMQSLSALLFGVSSHDPLTFAGAAVLVTVVAAVASLVPAYRATAVPLTEALRGG